MQYEAPRIERREPVVGTLTRPSLKDQQVA